MVIRDTRRLNPEQRAAVVAPDGPSTPCRAGSGKTRVFEPIVSPTFSAERNGLGRLDARGHLDQQRLRRDALAKSTSIVADWFR